MFSKHTIYIIFFLPYLTACSVTKGYPGPELPLEKVSQIFFRARAGVTLEDSNIDGIQEGVFNSGIAVLPGAHIVTLSALVAEEKECGSRSCHRVIERDKDGDIKREHCECIRPCYETIFRSTCTLQFDTQAGKQYSIEVSDSWSSYAHERAAHIRASEGDAYTFIASDTCSPFRYQRTRTSEEKSQSSTGNCW